MKFVKDRTFPAPVGRAPAAARMLDESGVAFLKKRVLGGALAEKKGEFLYVSAAQDTAFHLGFGRLVGPETWRAISSSGEALAFASRGDAAEGVTPAIPGQPLNFTHYVGGAALALKADTSTTVTVANANGDPCISYTVNKARTRDGLTAEVVDSFTFVDCNDTGMSGSVGVSAARLADGKRLQGVLFSRLDDLLEHEVAFRADPCDGTPAATYKVHSVVGQYASAGDLYRVGPGAFLAQVFYPRFSSATSTAALGVALCLSTDAGVTWERIAEGSLPMLADELASLRDLPNTANGQFNTAISFLRLYAAPLTGTKALVTASLPYFRAAESSPTNRYFGGRVKLGILDLAAKTLVALDTLYEHEDSAAGMTSVYNAHRYLQSGLVPMPGGVVVFTSEPVRADFPTSPRRVRFFDREAMALQDLGLMPFPAYRTGLPAAVSATAMTCPMYHDGGYWLYASTNRGATWARRALISGDTVAPPTPPGGGLPDGSLAVLNDLSRVLLLRRNGAGVSPTPGAPWASDVRFAPPA